MNKNIFKEPRSCGLTKVSEKHTKSGDTNSGLRFNGSKRVVCLTDVRAFIVEPDTYYQQQTRIDVSEKQRLLKI